MRQNQCDPDLPNLFVGKTNLTDKTIAKFKKDFPLYIVGMSDSECKLCCTTEPLLKALSEEFALNNYLYKVRSSIFKVFLEQIDPRGESGH